MKTLALLIAVLAATPASAEVYQCRSAQGVELEVQVEVAGNRLAMHDGWKVILLCGRRARMCGRSTCAGWGMRGRGGGLSGRGRQIR